MDLRTHIAARNRIDLAVKQAPFLQRDDVDLVEGAKALLGERSRRAQLASAERRQRPAGLGDQPLDSLEALLQRHWAVESHTLDSVTRERRRAARKLKDARQKAVAPCGKIDCTGHGAPPKPAYQRASSSMCWQLAASLPGAAAADQGSGPPKGKKLAGLGFKAAGRSRHVLSDKPAVQANTLLDDVLGTTGGYAALLLVDCSKCRGAACPILVRLSSSPCGSSGRLIPSSLALSRCRFGSVSRQPPLRFSSALRPVRSWQLRVSAAELRPSFSPMRCSVCRRS